MSYFALYRSKPTDNLATRQGRYACTIQEILENPNSATNFVPEVFDVRGRSRVPDKIHLRFAAHKMSSGGTNVNAHRFSKQLQEIRSCNELKECAMSDLHNNLYHNPNVRRDLELEFRPI